ncbi:MAG: hypothetical protein GY822_16845 [Deltaproteobacteria bacterium]|nr:hypothetical protein [Deltaproteobacteria bacterium]
MGAVCNDGHIPNKGRICLLGLCEGSDHCPSDATCLDVNASLGICSDGSFGTLCTSQQNVCVEGLDCTAALPGIPGVCFGEVINPVPPDLCDENAPCSSDQFCLNGICAPGCLSNTDCADDQYCDTEGTMRCVASIVTTCPDTPCAENQTCRDGLCVQVQVQTCTPTFDDNDGCDEYSLCLDHADIDAEDSDYRCTTMPPCPEDGICPTGGIGAVCNDGHLQGKARFCLSGLCDDGGDCATDFTCIDFNGPLGACSDGSLGMMCSAQQDICQEGTSCQSFGDDAGVCFPGGGPIGDGTCADLGGSCLDAFDCAGTPIFEATDCSFSEVCCPL